MRLMDLIPDCGIGASPMLNGQEMPDYETAAALSLEEMEEEYSRPMRQYESLLEQGKPRQAEELLEKIQELEDVIADLENELANASDRE